MTGQVRDEEEERREYLLFGLLHECYTTRACQASTYHERRNIQKDEFKQS